MIKKKKKKKKGKHTGKPAKTLKQYALKIEKVQQNKWVKIGFNVCKQN